MRSCAIIHRQQHIPKHKVGNFFLERGDKFTAMERNVILQTTNFTHTCGILTKKEDEVIVTEN